MRLDDDREPYATGEAVVVFIDAAKGKPVRIPDGLRTRLTEVKQ
jgi:acyl-CoA thioesterase FadM